jgi:hypothetical protein
LATGAQRVVVVAVVVAVPGAARTVQENTRIKALVYFDANAKHAYALAGGTPALRAFRGIAHIPYFNPVDLPEP